MMWWGDGWGLGAWVAMSVTMVAFWGGLAAVIVVAVRSRHTERHEAPPDHGGRADEVLAERFARGEIDEDEYTKRRELLHQL